MDFRSAASGEQPPVVNAVSNRNRPPQYLHPTTDGRPHQPADSYYIGDTHDQQRNHQCE